MKKQVNVGWSRPLPATVVLPMTTRQAADAGIGIRAETTDWSIMLFSSLSGGAAVLIAEGLSRLDHALQALQCLWFPAKAYERFPFQVQQILLTDQRRLAQVSPAHHPG